MVCVNYKHHKSSNPIVLYTATRLLLGFLMPPILGVSLYLLAHWISMPEAQFTEVIAVLGLGIYFGFIFVGLQSIIFTLLMEFFVRKRITVDWTAIKISALLGLFAGITLVSILDTLWILSFGVFVGAIVGWTLRRIEPHKPEE